MKRLRSYGWRRFRIQVRGSECNLFRELPRFPDSILVTGCQRSGTTILARIIGASKDIGTYRITHDDELDAALILSGRCEVPADRRYCFQTTYMYDCLEEYLRHEDSYQLIWLLRNPQSVVYSMLYNWKRFALNELFMAIGVHRLHEPYRIRLQRYGAMAIPAIVKASLSYRAKLDELHYLRDKLPPGRMLVVEYNDVVLNKDRSLREIFKWLGIEYEPVVAGRLKSDSLKKSVGLSSREKDFVERYCAQAYLESLGVVSMRFGSKDL